MVTSSPITISSPHAHESFKSHHLFESGSEISQLSERLKSKLRAQLQQRRRQQQQQEHQSLQHEQQNRSTPLLISGTGRHKSGIIHHRYHAVEENDDSNEDPPPLVPNAGEMGKPVILDKEKLSKDIQSLIDKGWEDNAFNQYVSDMISITRSLPDVRDPK